MKKILNFLRSMRFGLILLVLILGISILGSLIPQDRTAMEYVNRYGEEAAQWIVKLGADRIFYTPVFLGLLCAFALNLILCSVLRFARVIGGGKRLLARAETGENAISIDGQAAEALRSHLGKAHFHRRGQVFYRGFAGFYGSFVTHVAILLVLAVGAIVLFFSEVTDCTVMPGETLELEDGVQITVEYFQITDENGDLDYASDIRAVSGDGTEVTRRIRVNEPLRVDSYKIYQQTYGTAGAMQVRNLTNDAVETFTLTESCFLSADGQNGLFFSALYPGYIEGEDGGITLITSTSYDYVDPVYDLRLMEDGEATALLGFPGDSLTIGDIEYTLCDPVSYPGLRIKHMSTFWMTMLYVSFALMIVGLYLCFFTVPVCVWIGENGYRVLCARPRPELFAELAAIAGDNSGEAMGEGSHKPSPEEEETNPEP